MNAKLAFYALGYAMGFLAGVATAIIVFGYGDGHWRRPPDPAPEIPPPIPDFVPPEWTHETSRRGL